MKTTIKLLFLMSVLFFSTVALAQESGDKSPSSAPIPVEMFFGSNRLVANITMNKRISGSDRLGLIVSSYIAAAYDNDNSKNESMNVLLFSYDIYKGLGVIGGAALNSHWGFRPFAGGQYSYANKIIFAMLSSGFYLTETQSFEAKAIVQYMPRLKGNWSLYTKIDGLFSEAMDVMKHDRSALYGRLGLSYKAFGFGLAVDFDWYGPSAMSRENYGLFIRYAFK